MLGEGVDTTPSSNDDAVEEFLRSACTAYPTLSDQQQQCQNDAVTNKCTTHDKVCRALTHMVAAAKAHCCNTAKDHLYPSCHRQGLSSNTMHHDDPRPDATEEPALEMEFKVYTEDDLSKEKEAKIGCVRGMDVLSKLTTFMFVAEEVSDYGERCTKHLDWNVPSGAYDLIESMLTQFSSQLARR